MKMWIVLALLIFPPTRRIITSLLGGLLAVFGIVFATTRSSERNP